MRKSKSLSPKLKVQKPVPVLHKPVKADFKDLFKALAKGIGHTATGKWVELGGDAVEALAALGLTTEPGELVFLLIRRSLTLAVFELVGDSASQFSETAAADAETLIDSLDLSIEAEDMSIDQKFLDRPGDLPIVESFKGLLADWLKASYRRVRSRCYRWSTAKLFCLCAQSGMAAQFQGVWSFA